MKIRTAVIGTGHFGKHHVKKYASLPQSQLVAVCDADRDRAAALTAEFGGEAVGDYRDLLGKVDAVSVAVPSSMHAEVCKFLLQNNIHVLVEKPITDDPASARELIALARQNKLVLQVGHLERFRASRAALAKVLTQPLYIESTRITPFQPRVADVSVTLDLMIHDIDMILSLIDAPVDHVDAIGAPILSPREDIVNTRLRFANACVASVTASRIALKSERKMRIFQPDSYISMDLVANRMSIFRKAGLNADGTPRFDMDQQVFADDDPLMAEISAFLDCVRDGGEPLVSGEDGLRALETAMEVTAKLQAHIDLVRARLGEGALPAFPGS